MLSLSLLQSTKDSLARDDDTRARYSFSSYHRKESDNDVHHSVVFFFFAFCVVGRPTRKG